MDTFELKEQEELLENGRPATDKGPYFHHITMESYKGSPRGKLGGGFIGLGVGSLVGAAVAAVTAAITGDFHLGPSLMAVAGCAAGGTLYGMHEFSEVGKISGAVAMAHKLSETRMKEFEKAKFAEIKAEINELKALLKGKKGDAEAKLSAEAAKTSATVEHRQQYDYPTTHCDDTHCPPGPEGRKLVFWNVAGVGLAAGAALGAVLTAGGMTGHLLEAFGGAEHGLSELGQYGAGITAGAMFGASFGINRDLFRKVLDVTDPLFEGNIKLGLSRALGRSQASAVSPHEKHAAAKAAPPSPAVPTPTLQESGEIKLLMAFEGTPERSATYFRDRLSAELANNALHSLDPTRAPRQ